MAADVRGPANAIHELLAEVRAMRAMMEAVMGAPVTGGAWPGGKGGGGTGGGAGGCVLVRF